MYEVELKVRADHDRVRARLSELDAAPAGGVRQVDTYYDAPHRDFAETDEALRVRRESAIARGEDGGGSTTDGVGGGDDAGTAAGETRITYKGPLVEAESKTREEFETAVADGEAVDAILRGLGFEPAATVEKERERFALDGYAVTLDAVAGLGSFVEVEREVSDEGNVEEVREEAADLLRDLGLDPGAQIRTSYLGLLLGGE